MTTIEEVSRIQAYLRNNAQKNYRSLALPPFTVFLHPTDALRYYNYAIPDAPWISAGGAAVLPALRRLFHAHGRLARFEFFEAYAPDLPDLLRASGFVEEARQWSMVCTPADARPAPQVEGLTVTALNGESADADLRGFLLTQRQGFDPDNNAPVTPEEVDRLRKQFRVGGGQAFLGWFAGEPAGVSLFASIIDGVTELAGVATRAAFRRRGIAAYLTDLALRSAFAQGAALACLTAEDARAGSVYARVGFQPFSVMLAYAEEEPPSTGSST